MEKNRIKFTKLKGKNMKKVTLKKVREKIYSTILKVEKSEISLTKANTIIRGGEQITATYREERRLNESR